jgi:hypothetical protein
MTSNQNDVLKINVQYELVAKLYSVQCLLCRVKSLLHFKERFEFKESSTTKMKRKMFTT